MKASRGTERAQRESRRGKEGKRPPRAPFPRLKPAGCWPARRCPAPPGGPGIQSEEGWRREGEGQDERERGGRPRGKGKRARAGREEGERGERKAAGGAGRGEQKRMAGTQRGRCRRAHCEPSGQSVVRQGKGAAVVTGRPKRRRGRRLRAQRERPWPKRSETAAVEGSLLAQLAEAL